MKKFFLSWISDCDLFQTKVNALYVLVAFTSDSPIVRRLSALTWLKVDWRNLTRRKRPESITACGWSSNLQTYRNSESVTSIEFTEKQEWILVGCPLPTLVATTKCQYWGGAILLVGTSHLSPLSRQTPPPCRQTPQKEHGTSQPDKKSHHTPHWKEHGIKQPDKKWHHTPSCEQNDRQV